MPRVRFIYAITTFTSLLTLYYVTYTVTEENRPMTDFAAKEVSIIHTICNNTSGKEPHTERFDFKGTSQDDPLLIKYVKEEVLQPPSSHDYVLEHPEKADASQFGQAKMADEKYFHGKRGGFFIEAGAIDGEYLSNTLYFERYLGWRGLLIEPNPVTFKQLVGRHRNAYVANVALSTTTTASEVKFQLGGSIGEFSHIGDKGILVRSIPLYSLILAFDIQVVDFLSLDIEAFEVKILQTIPWDKVKFRLMCIEVNHIPEGLPYLKKYLKDKGYKFLGIKDVDAWFGWPSLLNLTETSSSVG